MNHKLSNFVSATAVMTQAPHPIAVTLGTVSMIGLIATIACAPEGAANVQTAADTTPGEIENAPVGGKPRPTADSAGSAAVEGSSGSSGSAGPVTSEEKPKRRIAGVASSTVALQFTLRFPDAANHYVEVEAVYPTLGRASLVLMMPVWTPGSYLVREYARHVEAVQASGDDGASRSFERVAKNRLRIDGDGTPAIRLKYRVYGREGSVRTNFIDADHAVITPAATFYADADRLNAPVRLEVNRPPTWPDIAVALPRVSIAGNEAFAASDFDALVDAPLLIGQLERRRFEVQNVPVELVTWGGGDVWDGDRAAADVEKIARATAEFWSDVPFRRYLFLNVLNEYRGGLEHRASTLMMASRWVTRKEEDYRRWLGLVTHEFFHTWNGKRLRPRPLGPFDFERENYVRTLWFVEGFTSYYDNLLLVRAGLYTMPQYFKQLSRDIERSAATPGVSVQSLDDASYDAWIKFYRPDENSKNTRVSYYGQGALLGWALDARIRAATKGRRSLDDVMRLAYAQFSGAEGYERDDLLAVVSAVGGEAAAAWLDAAAARPEPIDYGPALAYFGLRFKDLDKPPADSDADAEQHRREKAWLGLEVDGSQHLTVKRVVRGGPAYRAGVNVADELIGLGGYRLTDIKADVSRHAPGDRLPMVVARRGQLRTIEIEIGTRPRTDWSIEVDPAARSATKQRRAAWLGR